MIKDIQELNFPKDEGGRQYATLTGAVCSLPDMGEKTITSTVKIDGGIAPDFSYDWEVAFKGEKYIMPLRQPQGLKDNESMPASIDLTFQHWAVWQLKRWPFFSIVDLEAANVLPDQYEYPISLNLGDFITLFGKVLKYYYGDKITIDLNPDWEYAEEPSSITISHTLVWDVLFKSYELFAVRWQIEPNGDIDHYVIKVGYPTTEIDHTFEYGFEGGLLKVERQVQDENIRNMIIGRGGERNLPYRYFKQHDEDNVSYSPDPDWVPELADRYFSELHGATFRSYVQGWNHKHYGRTSVTSADMAYSQWAWLKGYSDDVFNPVEFVTDEIVAEPQVGDRYVQLFPDFNAAIKKDSSIDKYGPLFGGLDNNEEIYPTIQGVTIPPYGRIDQVVDVQKILSDDVEASTQSDAVITKDSSLNCRGVAKNVGKSSYKSITVNSNGNFTVSKGKTANLIVSLSVLYVVERNKRLDTTLDAEIEPGSESVMVYNTVTGEQHSASGIPEGTWRYEASCRVHNETTDKTLNITIGDNNVKLEESTTSDQWGDTWDVWVKNIWQTEKLDGESEEEYAERVWIPILGDRTGAEAKIVFSSGWLSTSEDYEFTIVATPVYDTSKSLDGVQSHWRITLAKSDADLEATGLYLPSTKRQANAGDYFFFIGIDMPHLYVVEAEKRLDDWKKDELAKVSDIKPTWVVSLDKVRIHNYGKAGAIIDSIHPGDTFTLRDERFISGSHQEKLYITSVTYTYTEPTNKEANLLPDVEVVLSDSYTTSANPVATLQGEVSALQKQVGAISNIEQIVRAVGDKLYLRKDGFTDRSYSPTEFASLLTSAGFRNGIIGGAGWGFYKDENGNWVLETDRLNVRQDMTVSTLVTNQAEGRGGMQIDTAAYIEVTRVEETDDAYICYFDQKQGTVANLFHVDDVAFNQTWTPENQDLKFYKRKVVAVSDDSVSLSKSITNGIGTPTEGDIIIHYGNYTDKTRQYVKVRDVVGGGYERYIEGLDSVNSDGTEYYFVGRQSGMYGDMPRWYIGNPESNIEYINRRFNLNNVTLSVNSFIGDKPISDYLRQISGVDYLKAALAEDSYMDGGIFLTSLIRLGTDNKGVIEQNVTAGINGITDATALGNGIALWLGGEQEDREATGADLAKAAATLLRFDGSGYLANGNIKWDNTGAGSVAGGNITWDALGAVTIGTGVTFNISNVQGLQTTLDSLASFTAGLGQLFTVIDESNDEHNIAWAAVTANAQRVKSIRAKFGLWTDFFLTAKGKGSDSQTSGGASVLSALNDVSIISPSDGQTLVYDSAQGKWVNRAVASGLDQAALASYLTANNYAKIYDIPSLDGYATEQWVSSKGYITTSDIPTSLPASDVYAWAKAATKPSYAFNEITSKPTSLAGYGITDAASKTNTIAYSALANYVAARFSTQEIAEKAAETYIEFWQGNAGWFNFAIGSLTAKGQINAESTIRIGECVISYDSANGGLKFSKGIYSESYITAKGRGTSSDSAGAAYTRLDAWTDYSTSKDGYVLSAKLGYDLHQNKADVSAVNVLTARVASLEGGSALSVTTTGNGNAITDISKNGTSITVTKGATFLTSHQSLANYVTINTEQTITGTKTFSSAIVQNQNNSASWWLSTAVRGKFVATHGGSSSGWSPVLGFKTVDGKYEIGSLGDTAYICYYADTRDTNGVDCLLTIPKKRGTLAVTEDLTNYLSRSGGSMANTNVVTNLNADLLDGLHESDIRQRCQSFALFRGSSTTGGYDLDSLLQNGGMTTNFGSLNYWKNAPEGFSYGSAICFKPYNVPSLLGMLAWDIKYKDANGNFTKSLWWRICGDPKDVDTDMPLWGQWEQIAFTTSTVAKANQLATARSLWGRSFDGSASVSGDMTGVGNITMSGSITMGTLSLSRSNNSTRLAVWSNESEAGPLNVKNLLVSNSWPDAAKVPTNGIYCKGQAILGSLKIGDATLTWDATNQCIKIDKGFVSESFITAKKSS